MRILILALFLVSSSSAFAWVECRDLLPGDDSVPGLCCATAYRYATKWGGQPWSDDAWFENAFGNFCHVYVTQVGDHGQPCHNIYAINMLTWENDMLMESGCRDVP